MSTWSYHASSVRIPARSPHRSRYSRDARDHDRAPVGRVEPAVATEDLEACRQPFDVPLPRAGKRLVEVVDVEQHLPLGRAEHTEVRQVRVAAQLHVDPGPGGRGEVGRHDQRAAAEERERRRRASAHGGSGRARDTSLGLLLEERDRVGPRSRGLPGSVGRSRRRGPRRSSPRNALFNTEMLMPSRPRRVHCSGLHETFI